MRRDARRAYLKGYSAGRRAARAEQAAEFQAIKRDIQATRRHLNRIEALDQLDVLMTFDRDVTVH